MSFYIYPRIRPLSSGANSLPVAPLTSRFFHGTLVLIPSATRCHARLNIAVERQTQPAHCVRSSEHDRVHVAASRQNLAVFAAHLATSCRILPDRCHLCRP